MATNKDRMTDRAVEHINRVCPHDIGGRMVLAAFAQDAIDHADIPEKDNDPA